MRDADKRPTSDSPADQTMTSGADPGARRDPSRLTNGGCAGIRVATMADVPALNAMIAESAVGLSAVYYSPAQVNALVTHVFGGDMHLVADGTYYVIDAPDGTSAAAGGWSWRGTRRKTRGSIPRPNRQRSMRSSCTRRLRDADSRYYCTRNAPTRRVRPGSDVSSSWPPFPANRSTARSDSARSSAWRPRCRAPWSSRSCAWRWRCDRISDCLTIDRTVNHDRAHLARPRAGQEGGRVLQVSPAHWIVGLCEDAGQPRRLRLAAHRWRRDALSLAHVLGLARCDSRVCR